MDNGRNNTLGKCCAIYLTIVSTYIVSFSFSSVLVSDIFAVRQRPETRSTTLEVSCSESLYIRCMLCIEIQESNIPQRLIQNQRLLASVGFGQVCF